MPIRPEMKHLYPKNWPYVRAEVLQRADNCCERCGISNHAYGYRDAKGHFHELEGIDAVNPPSGVKTFVVHLTIAHLDHNPTNNDLGNLEALCCQCHNRHDAPVRAADRKRRLRRQYNEFQVGINFGQNGEM